MQLQFAYVLKQMLPLTCHHSNEHADIELETGITLPTGRNNIDILLIGRKGDDEIRIAVELKCYRAQAASGGVRGAQNIFMKDVYEDLQILEHYVKNAIASSGVALVMTDHRHFINPSVKRGACWAYDISSGYHFPSGSISIDIANKTTAIQLERHYRFNWVQFGSYWFVELQGTES